MFEFLLGFEDSVCKNFKSISCCKLPFRVELLLYDNLLGIKLIVLVLASSFRWFDHNEISIRHVRSVQLVSELWIVNPQIGLVLDVRLIRSHFLVKCSFVEFTIVDDLLIILNTQLELENTC